MAKATLNFALNHMIYPSWAPKQLIDAAHQLGVKAIELRNDIGNNSLQHTASAASIAAYARKHDIAVLSINALANFNAWTKTRAAQAQELAELAHAAGCTGIVLCPLMSDDASELAQVDLYQALNELASILARYDLHGFVEPIGYQRSTLRSKVTALEAIEALGLAARFSVVHDTFHHYLGADERDIVGDRTGIVHISGIDDPTIAVQDMQDEQRVLVNQHDRLHNLDQLRQLFNDGYDGYVAFEPFAQSIQSADEPIKALQASMEYVRAHLEKANS